MLVLFMVVLAGVAFGISKDVKEASMIFAILFWGSIFYVIKTVWEWMQNPYFWVGIAGIVIFVIFCLWLWIREE